MLSSDKQQNNREITVRLSEKRTVRFKIAPVDIFTYENEESIEDAIHTLFLMSPEFLKSEAGLKEAWQTPESRLELLKQTEKKGFSYNKLKTMQKALSFDDSDLMDLLLYIGWGTQAVPRKERAQRAASRIKSEFGGILSKLLEHILNEYIKEGENTLGYDSLAEHIQNVFGSSYLGHAKFETIMEIKNVYRKFQHFLYTD